MFLDHTQRRSTVDRTPLDEWSARRRDLYLITHDTHNRQISMPPVGFELKISAGERLLFSILHSLQWVREVFSPAKLSVIHFHEPFCFLSVRISCFKNKHDISLHFSPDVCFRLSMRVYFQTEDRKRSLTANKSISSSLWKNMQWHVCLSVSLPILFRN